MKSFRKNFEKFRKICQFFRCQSFRNNGTRSNIQYVAYRMYCIMQFLKYIIPKPLKYSPMSLNSMRFQKCYNFHCSKCTKSILFQKEDASSSRRKCSQLLRMPNCCQKFLRGTLGKKNFHNELFHYFSSDFKNRIQI